MNEEYKCKDCKWLTGRKNIRGVECMNPVLQEKWNGQKNMWMGELRKDTARYKQRNAPACKKFEAKESKPMVRCVMSDDLIKRSDAIKVMACEMYAEAQSQGYDVDSIEDFIPEAKAWINDAPSADRPRGKWIDISEWYAPRQKCSVCETVVDGYGSNFCPNCGAEMKGADDDSYYKHD